MEHFESLNAIVDEFAVKKTTLSIFMLSDLYDQGKAYTPAEGVDPAHFTTPLTVTYDNEDSSFCSIFSDPDTANTQGSVFDSSHTKLRSDNDVLSSEFDQDVLQPILTSDATQ